MKHKAVLVAAVVFLITSVMLIIGGVDALINYTEPVTARLVSSEAYTVRDYSDDGIKYVTKYRGTWEYEYGGKTYTTDFDYSSKPDSTKTLLVDPDDPAKTSGNGGAAIALALAGAALVLGLLFVKIYRG